MKNNIYSNIKVKDALESFFECITHCSIYGEGAECATKFYTKHLKSIKYSWKEIYLAKTQNHLNRKIASNQ